MNKVWIAAHLLDLSPATIMEFLDKLEVEYTANFTVIKPKNFAVKKFMFIPSRNGFCESIHLSLDIEDADNILIGDNGVVTFYEWTTSKVLYTSSEKIFYINEDLYYKARLGELL